MRACALCVFFFSAVVKARGAGSAFLLGPSLSPSPPSTTAAPACLPFLPSRSGTVQWLIKTHAFGT